MSTAAVHQALDPDHLVRIHAVTGLTFADAITPAQALGATDPAVVVINLGTNDIWYERPLAQIEGDLDAVVEQFPSSCMVMATVNEHTVNAVSGAAIVYDNEAAHALNEVIRTKTSYIADWDAAANVDGGRYLDSGTIHPTPDGEQLLASVVSAQVDRCLEASAGSVP